MRVFLENYLWLLGNLVWINIVFGIIIVFFERRNPTSTWLWIMVLALLPGVGFLFYLFLGQDLSKKRIFKGKTEDDGCFTDMAALQKNKMAKDRFHYDDPNFPEYEDLIMMHLKSSDAFFSQDNNVEIYFNGDDKFEALLDSIYKAEKYIHMEYYIFKNDHLGNKIIDTLVKKAEDGVEVRLLVDGMGGRSLTKKSKDRLINAGGKVAVFLPPFVPFISIRINYRNHRKICVIDGKEGYLGGFNIGNEYLGLSKKFGNWRDTHIKIKGSAVSSLQWRFYLDWKFAAGEDLKICQSYLHEESANSNVGIQIVSSGPDSKWPNIKDGYLKMISNARHKIYIETPYFIPDDSILEALRIAGLSGLDVRVMMPNKPDHPFVYWASLSYIGELLEVGVKFYHYGDGFLHSKVIIVDDFISTIGTANLDIRSFLLNFEVNAFIYDDMVNLKLTEKFINDIDLCKEITLDNYNNRSNIVKIKESISRLLSPVL